MRVCKINVHIHLHVLVHTYFPPPATPGDDYGAVSTTLQATPGDTQVCFDIVITNDPFVEERLECFTLEISLGPNPPDVIVLDPSTNAECCIEDDDRKCTTPHTIKTHFHSKLTN